MNQMLMFSLLNRNTTINLKIKRILLEQLEKLKVMEVSFMTLQCQLDINLKDLETIKGHLPKKIQHQKKDRNKNYQKKTQKTPIKKKLLLLKT